MSKFKIIVAIKLLVLVPCLIAISLGVDLIMNYLNVHLPTTIKTIIIGLLLSACVIMLFWKETSEVNIAGIKIKESQKAADDILVKYQEFRNSVTSFMIFNLAVLEKDGSFDNVTGSKHISEFLYSVKNMKIEMGIRDESVERLQKVGKLKLFQSYQYELATRFNVQNIMQLGIPEFVGGSYDTSILNIDWGTLEKSEKQMPTNKRDEFQQILSHMKKDFENL